MVQISYPAVLQLDLHGDPVAAGRIVQGLRRIGIFKGAIAHGICRKPQQVFLIQFVNHAIHSFLLKGGEGVRRINIREDAVLPGFDIEYQWLILHYQGFCANIAGYGQNVALEVAGD